MPLALYNRMLHVCRYKLLHGKEINLKSPSNYVIYRYMHHMEFLV